MEPKRNEPHDYPKPWKQLPGLKRAEKSKSSNLLDTVLSTDSDLEDDHSPLGRGSFKLPQNPKTAAELLAKRRASRMPLNKSASKSFYDEGN